ncbi:hypothetical protein AVEN_162897-1 [Araneus ventricosus]|uniref:Uncharacterized protein n=1 Tax=Araneus ventricosus TaxID=182803 RepID=A0A4Y2PMU6_ARAVE|nr:hypothetical protein AVEN_162897-1 [Araneus ventricosus]
MSPAGAAACCSRSTKSGKKAINSPSNHCNHITNNSKCSLIATHRWRIQSMKFSVTLCSLSTEMRALSPQINSSSSCDVAGLFLEKMCFHVPHKLYSQGLRSSEYGNQPMPVPVNVE